ncbi:MAG: hypothetical protein HSCHL_0009 [Hydrogenibacillus schlegelii]|uniref:Uncharacterized protein n=1 Tax=Hydrogenibacillus schlegelii TaxID=1484 RepID=A0A2T5G978_HYDSH|nr:MAG: hypothetical protein HSCHL_0009 [Hydrogenibacillus schlegelii]
MIFPIVKIGAESAGTAPSSAVDGRGRSRPRKEKRVSA